MSRATYDGFADTYDAYVDEFGAYYQVAAEALRRLLGPGSGRCLDLGCGGGHFTSVAAELGWTVTGVDASADQLRVARRRLPAVDFIRCDARTCPSPIARSMPPSRPLLTPTSTISPAPSRNRGAC